MKSLIFSAFSLLILFVSMSLASERSLAQKMPPLPKGPPEQVRVDVGAVKKATELLFDTCRSFTNRQTQGPQTAAKSKKVREFCLCVAKDIQRREDLGELKLISQHYRGQIAEDANLSDIQSLHLHELSKTEENCRRDPNYRFGAPEPRLPTTGNAN